MDDVLTTQFDFYKRYVDDILIIGRSRVAKKVKASIKSELARVDLHLNMRKSLSGSNLKPLVFLGYKVYKGVVSISDENVERFLRRIAAKFTWYKDGYSIRTKRPTWLQSDDLAFNNVFLEELNEAITGIISSKKNYGWLFYFSEINDLALLFKLDKIIRSFFSKLGSFNNEAPISLKRLVRAHFAIRHGDTSYTNNFDQIDTVRKKRNYLIQRGQINPQEQYSEERLLELFEHFKMKKTKELEQDVGDHYF